MVPEKLSEIVRAFQERGLLRQSDGLKNSVVDLSHESVMWQWSRLGRWIAEEAEQAAQLRFLLQSARQQILLGGLTLESALKLRSGWQKQRLLASRYLTEPEIEQVDAWIAHSKQIDTRKRYRRIWTLVGIGTIILTLTAVAFWLSSKQQKAAQARELSAWAALSLSDDPERSLILGIHSWSKVREMVGGLEQFLHEATLQSRTRLTLRGHQSYVSSIVWSPDGSKLATASWDKMAKVWDATTGRELLTLRGHRSDIYSIAWSPDGSKLATASQDETAKVWDATTGRELLTLRGHRSDISSIAWSPDGSKLATASQDETAKVWKVATGRELFTLQGHQGAVFSIAWSPDGKRLASAGNDATTQIYAIDSIELLRLVRSRITRDLTTDECQRYLSTDHCPSLPQVP